jgi:hypothetical protein
MYIHVYGIRSTEDILVCIVRVGALEYYQYEYLIICTKTTYYGST